ncbi:hypothetical protein [Liquorilactobacillus mali]|uniref:hypothetical protein n=1 Tax=Liquorilactobacillus mali TaxID=1618 RepID=UPI002954A5BC|nr:hypothetical protein [Liquorilactobacillus mali]MDV7758268.1 hypothetical protein [Liquorilactobacillus mali]
MFKAEKKQVEIVNKPIYNMKQQEVEQYRAELQNYSQRVVLLSLKLLKDKEVTAYKISAEEELGKLLSSPPELGELSLPQFLGQVGKEGNPYEVVDLPYGYLYIIKGSDGYHIAFHLEKPSELNPYLDAKKTFKQVYPAIIRDTSKVATTTFTISRIFTLLK